MKKYLLFLLPLLLLSSYIQAAYLTNVPRQLIQPNGDTLHCFISGDEYHHWLHDKEGYTIIQDIETGYYVYAVQEGEELVPTAYIAGKVNPAAVGLAPHQNISAALWVQKRKQMEAHQLEARPTKGKKNHGVLNNIIIFINFADDKGFDKSFGEVERMFNDSSANAVSMYNFFKQMSFNKLSTPSHFFPKPQGDKILSYTDIYPRAHYEKYSPVSNYLGYQNESERTEREHQLIERALAYVNPMIPADINLDYNDDGYVDNVCFIVKGEVGDWSSLLWPHKWSLYSRNCTLGGKQVNIYNFQLEGTPGYFNTSVFCHEMFHSLGAPDLYHYEEAYNKLASVGRWDLMANNTNPPQQTSAYMKYQYGKWIDNVNTITTNGTYTLYPGNSNRADKMCYVMPCSDREGEYYAFEYRRQSKPNDSTIYGSGLMIYRINTKFSGNANYNGTTILDEVYLFRPGGTLTNNGDISNAHFDASQGRDHVDSTTNTTLFFSDGTIDKNFNISYISEPGDSLVFSIGSYYAQCTPDNVVLGQGIDTCQITISSNTSWEILGADTAKEWLHVSQLEGKGNAVITLTTLSANTSTDERICYLKLHNDNIEFMQTITISQKGVEPYFEVSTDTIFVDNDNLSNKLIIRSNCAWHITINGKETWLSIDKMSGTGSDTITFTAKNTSKFSRVISFTLNNRYVHLPVMYVKHKGIEPILYVDCPDGENKINFPNKLTSFTTTLHANMDWIISYSLSSWYRIDTLSGSGTTDFTITSIDTNTTARSRKTDFSIFGENGQILLISVYQDGYEFYATINPNHVELGNISGFSQDIEVNANASWRTSGSASWYTAKKQDDSTLTISSKSLNYTNEKRIDTLFVYEQSDYNRKKWIPLVISQEPCYITLSKDTIVLENRAGSSAKLDISTNTRWYVTGLLDWVSLSKKYGAGDITIDVKATQKTSQERICRLSFTDRKGINTPLVVKQLTTSEMDDYLIKNLRIYPNPAHHVIHIDNNQMKIENVTLFDSQGRRVLQEKIADSYSVTLNTSTLESGIYFVQITGDGHVVTKRVIVQ